MNKNDNLISPEWYREDIIHDNRWIRHLSSDEIFIMLNSIRCQKPIGHNNLINLFEEIFSGVINLNGFIIVKGFPIPNDEFSTNAIRTFFLEFCRFLGTPLIQNKKQDYLFDIKVINSAETNPNARGPQISDALPLHADHGGLLGMYSLQSAEIGGNTLLASTHTVHYEMESSRPDLLEVLYQPFYGDRRGQEPDGQLPYDYNPIFALKDNQLLCQYAGYYLDDTSEKFPHLPPLTQQQRDAIEFFRQTTDRKDIQFEVKLEPGDVIFINNNRVLHGRTSFQNQNIKTVRHLLRIWLSTPRIKSFPHYYGYSMPN